MNGGFDKGDDEGVYESVNNDLGDVENNWNHEEGDQNANKDNDEDFVEKDDDEEVDEDPEIYTRSEEAIGITMNVSGKKQVAQFTQKKWTQKTLTVKLEQRTLK